MTFRYGALRWALIVFLAFGVALMHAEVSGPCADHAAGTSVEAGMTMNVTATDASGPYQPTDGTSQVSSGVCQAVLVAAPLIVWPALGLLVVVAAAGLLAPSRRLRGSPASWWPPPPQRSSLCIWRV